MPEIKKHNLIVGILFILQAAAALLYFMWILRVFPQLAVSILTAAIVFYSVQAALIVVITLLRKELLAPSIFFLLMGSTGFLPAEWHIFVVYLYYSIVPYLFLILIVPGFESARGWLKWGKLDRLSAVMVIVTVIVSSGSLVLWTYLFKPDMSGLLEIIPFDNIPLLIALILGFSLFNAIGEETVFRGILQEALKTVFPFPFAAVTIQCLLFGVWHFYGFPSGVSGMALVWLWGAALGWLRERTGGMLAPLLAHFFADFTIILIVVLTRGQIG
ncbi:MAG: hypothetical protein A2Y33_02990 [Spirochaetes bacterium GWF1_51_8]|nr:MAG: hypothetical protein A2Y33_02990 [Spirochaetes bacterium GWF1_51_8]